jgi:hypothetical protein
MNHRTIRRRRAAASVLFAALVFGAPVAVAAPPADLPGIISSNDIASGIVPLGAAAVQFYLTTMRAAIARAEHPTAADTADIAESTRLRALELAGMLKASEVMKTSDLQKAMGYYFQPTPQQTAVMERGTALKAGQADGIIAAAAGMPSRQWDPLRAKVEDAAGINDGEQWGNGGDSPTGPASAAGLERAAKVRQTSAANRALVASNAAEIKRLHEAYVKITTERAQAAMAEQ